MKTNPPKKTNRKTWRSRRSQYIIFTTLWSMVAIRKTCGAGGGGGPKQDLIATYKQTQQLEPRAQHSWLSGLNVNDGFWGPMGVCIDYRICPMGHNSRRGRLGSVVPPDRELCNPYKSTPDKTKPRTARCCNSSPTKATETLK